MKNLLCTSLVLGGLWLSGPAFPSHFPPLSQNAMHRLASSEQNKAVIRRLYLDILNTGKLELLDEVVAPGYVGPNGEAGPAGLAATIAPLRAAFPDIQWTLDEVLAEGDKVVVRWTWHGTHQAVFRGFAPSHRAVSNQAIAIYTLRAGKILAATLQSDRLGFFQQLGAVPPGLGATPARSTKP
jgi:steroid delta-isomerase-like uncharacterized protein